MWLASHEGLEGGEGLKSRLVSLPLELCVGIEAPGDFVDAPVSLGTNKGGNRIGSIHVGYEMEDDLHGLPAYLFVVGGSKYLLVSSVEETVAATRTHLHLETSDAWRGIDIKKVGSSV